MTVDSTIIYAFLLTLFAGLATGVGSLIGLLSKKFNPKVLTIALGFSAGVMIYVSMVEIFAKANRSLAAVLGTKNGHIMTVIAFFTGMFFIAVIDKLIPSYENPHELNVENKIQHASEKEKSKLMRMGAFSALAIAIHNFPEGLATFMTGINDPALGISIAVAIAIHNIPEGLAVSAPIFYATKSRKKPLSIRSFQVSPSRSGRLSGILSCEVFYRDHIRIYFFLCRGNHGVHLARRIVTDRGRIR